MYAAMSRRIQSGACRECVRSVAFPRQSSTRYCRTPLLSSRRDYTIIFYVFAGFRENYTVVSLGKKNTVIQTKQLAIFVRDFRRRHNNNYCSRTIFFPWRWTLNLTPFWMIKRVVDSVNVRFVSKNSRSQSNVLVRLPRIQRFNAIGTVVSCTVV